MTTTLSSASPIRSTPVAYITSRFPKLSETFILNEVLELERQGLGVGVYALVEENEPVTHTPAAEMLSRVFFAPLASPRVIRDQIHWLRHRPRCYLRAWWRAVRGNLGSPAFAMRAVVVVPKAASFARQMERAAVRHVHAHWATHTALAAYVVAELTDIPFSFTAHAHDIQVNQTMLVDKINKAAFVVTISDYNRRILQSLAPDDRSGVHVIRCGVDLGGFTKGNVERGAPGDDEPLTIVCVASLEARKGHRHLLEAVAQIRAAGLAVRVSLVGAGAEERAIADSIEELGLGDVVTMHGAQPSEQVAALLASADIYVQPSVTMPNGKSEGIPVALMEAMATGVPVVATRLSGVPELVIDHETGLLVPEADADALAAALWLLYEDASLRSELARAGRHMVEREFELSANVERLRVLLESSAATHQPDSRRKSGVSP